jgi:protein-disulfide isomerase
MGITKSDTPVVNVFVMSYCPYGTQIEKGVIPVQQLLGSKADININFVQYTMHGQKEGDENTAQYCIQKEQKDKYWQYLTCFLDKSDSAGCQDKAGIDKTKLQACIASADSEFNISSDMAAGSQYPRYRVNEEMAKKYGIQGSPGLVINEKMISSGRDSESLKKAICCAFNKKPAECGQTLSSAAPAPGFGFSGTGSGAAASCGG